MKLEWHEVDIAKDDINISKQKIKTEGYRQVEGHGKTRLAVLFHGIALVVILFFYSAWIGKVPNLAVAVALVLVATQMIDDETRNAVWRGGYEPTASNASVGITWFFWRLLGLGVLVGSVLRYFDFWFCGWAADCAGAGGYGNVVICWVACLHNSRAGGADGLLDNQPLNHLEFLTV